jgi:hypothetical protein
MMNTAHGLSGHAYHEALLEEVYKQFHQTGNLKDQVDAQLTAFKTVASNALHLIGDLAFQMNIRTMLENPTELDSQDFDSTGPSLPISTLESFNNLIGILEDYQIPVPNYIPALIKLMNVKIKLQDSYIVRDISMPPAYIIPFCPKYGVDSLKSVCLQGSGTPGDGILTNMGLAKLHMDKFGIKYTPFSKSMLEPTELSLSDDLAIAHLSFSDITIWETGDATYHCTNPSGQFETEADFQNAKYYFKSDPTCDLFRIINLIYGTYAATYNIYSGITVGCEPKNTTGNMGAVKAAFTDAAFTNLHAITDANIFAYFLALWRGDETDQTHLITKVDGSAVTAGAMTYAFWPMIMAYDLWCNSGNGPSYLHMKDYNLKWFGEHLFSGGGRAKRKGSKD